MRLFSLLPVFAIVCLITACSPNEASSKKHALLIGIDRYLYTSDLVGQKNDVRRMKELLVEHRGFPAQQVYTLLDEQATRENIEQAFIKLKAVSNPGDTLLVYFTGHGFQIDDDNGDESDKKDEVLMAHDAGLLSQVKPRSTVEERWAFRNMIRDDDFKVWLDALDDREVEVIIDSCHSGTATKAPNLPSVSGQQYLIKQPLEIRSIDGNTVYKSPSQGKAIEINEVGEVKQKAGQAFVETTVNRKVWTASSADQVAFVDYFDGEARSVFTYYYIEGFIKTQDGNREKINSYGNELFDYLRTKSVDYCHKNESCLELEPTYE